MGVPILNQITGQLTLGQQGVGSDGFSLDVDGIEQGDDGFDFVGLFFLIAAFYRQCAHFFWV